MNRELVIARSNIVFDGKGFTIGMENEASNHQTIALSSVKNVTVKNVNIIGTYLAISFQHTQNNTVQNVTGGTISLWDSTNNIITQSTATFTFQESNHNTIINCTTGGFEFSSSNNNSILNNNCSDSGRALYLADSSNNLVFGNTFTKFWWWISMYGDSSNNTIVGNDIRTRQLYLADNLVGINYIFHNNFFDFKWNKTTTTNSANIWSNNGEGNYWSDFNGTDANHDGISDTPYLIDTTNTDSYPLMNPVDIANELLPAINK
jgi:nitrous oxidase accessory protein